MVYAAWLLPGTAFDLGVADVTLAQFEELAHSLGKDLSNSQGSTPKGDWPQLISQSLLSLEQLLKVRNSFLLSWLGSKNMRICCVSRFCQSTSTSIWN